MTSIIVRGLDESVKGQLAKRAREHGRSKERRLPDSRRRKEGSTRIDAAVALYRGGRAVLAFDEAAAAPYADVFVARESAGLPISTADAQIAAICRALHAVRPTRNQGLRSHRRRSGEPADRPWDPLIVIAGLPGAGRTSHRSRLPRRDAAPSRVRFWGFAGAP